MLVAFTLLGFFGHEVYRKAPPLPDRVVTEDGTLLMTRDQILDGQQVWQSTGGQQLGYDWGQGAYQAPDWSADWLHRESLALLSIWSEREHGQPYENLDPVDRAALASRLPAAMRTSTYNPATGTLTISRGRAEAVARTAAHYRALFGGDPSLAELRRDYAMQDGDGARPAAPAGPDPFPLLDQLGLRHPKARNQCHLYKQLAA